MKLPQGNIKRMSVSILVDHTVRWDGVGPKAKRIVEAPPPEKLKSIHDLVAGVIGLSTERGDQLVVEALPFEATRVPEQFGPEPSSNPQPKDTTPVWLRNLLGNKMVLIGVGIGLVVLLGGVVMFFRRGGSKKTAEMKAQLEAAPLSAIESAAAATKQMEAQIADQAATKKQQEVEAMRMLKLPQVTTKKSEVLTKHIAEEAKRDATSMVQVLRSWMNEPQARR